MTQAYLIELSPRQPQTFSTVLGGRQVRCSVQYCSAGEFWTLSIFDADTEEPLVLGQPLVTGVGLLDQYPDLQFSGQLIVQSDGDGLSSPTFETLGETSNLYFVTA